MNVSRVTECRYASKIQTIVTSKKRMVTEGGQTVWPCDSLVRQETQPCTVDMADSIRSWSHAGGCAVEGSIANRVLANSGTASCLRAVHAFSTTASRTRCGRACLM